MTPSPTPPADGLQRAPLDIYKKIAVVRSADDAVTYEDSQGRQQTISGLGDEAISANPSLQPKVKLDIPVPRISVVETYEKNVPATYDIPKSYVRYTRASMEEIQNKVEYNLDMEDENWLNNHPRFGTFINEKKRKAKIETDDKTNDDEKSVESEKTSNKSNKRTKRSSSKNESVDSIKENESMDEFDSQDEDDGDDSGLVTLRPTLSLSDFEHMIDILEKATEFETIITLSQAERLILAKIPSLLQTFKSSGSSGPTIKCDKKRKKNPTNVRTVINDVYNYWIQKRSKLKKPLLRKYWPVTASNDTNPHLVFRPREKEKYKLRKKRQNDYDAYRKMKQLRIDFAKVRVLLDLIKRREEINRTVLDMQCDWFDQRVYDMIDTSGLPKESDRLCRNEIDELFDIPKHFDTQSINDKGKKRKRSKKVHNNKNSARASPAPTQGTTESDSVANDQPTSNENSSAAPTKVIADQEHPPLFLHPLETRESYATSWDNAVPFVTSYVDSHPTPTFRFRHRPRIGRGGRVIIDRLPRPGNPDCPPVNVFTAGDESSLRRANEPKNTLLDLLPEPLDHKKLSRRIEEIAASALSDEEETRNQAKGYNSLPTANDTSGAEDNDGEDILVKVNDWMETDEQLWGEELCAIGPV